MTEDVEKGNLIYKLEVFFNSCILHGWKDSILTLQTTKSMALCLWSEDLSITSRCIEAIASKVLSHPSKVSLSHSHSRRLRDDVSSCNGTESMRHKSTSKGWWAEDLAELSIDLYWRAMIAIKSGGKTPSNLIGDALKIYASRWLPSNGHVIKNKKEETLELSDSDSSDSASEIASKHRLLLESIVSLLPSERGAVSCSFLLKLLKACNILSASCSSKSELARRVALQLEEATVNDLLIPSISHTNDVDLVMTILELFMSQGQSPPTSPPRMRMIAFERRRSRSAENIDFEFQESRRSSSASHGSKLKVAKLVDRYLQEVARDVNLPLSKFIALAEAIPDFARHDHDDIYRAIDTYLKAHPELNKSERKRLCRILDCKKLSMEACMHAAQNELLPLRVVVQVLFFEQARAAASTGKVADIPSNIKALLKAHGIDPSSKHPPPLSTTTSIHGDDSWSVNGFKTPNSTTTRNNPTLRMKLAEDKDMDNINNDENGRAAASKFKGQPKRMLSKFWSTNKSVTGRN
ncbi:hypothetical protein PIB30_030543 [Stylosanthes scabra]|nr:hypothetical protein [Stylosanthes scabra]